MKKRGMRLKKITSYIRDYWYYYVFILVCMFIAIGLDMLYPQITKIIVNDIFVGQDYERLPMLLLAIVLIGAGRSIFGYLKEFTADKTGARIGAEMRKELFTHIQGLSMDYFGETNTGELMARVKDDIDHVWLAIGFIGTINHYLILRFEEGEENGGKLEQEEIDAVVRQFMYGIFS